MDKKVKALELNLTTARDQAEYYFNREFSAVSIDKLTKAARFSDSVIEVHYPSDEYVIREMLGSYENQARMIKAYEEESGVGLPMEDLFESCEFIQYMTQQPEFEDERSRIMTDHYPMWNTVFKCDDHYFTSESIGIDTLYSLGIGILEDEEGDYYLFIAGAGYDFYDAHWIPLFKHMGWIKEIEDEE